MIITIFSDTQMGNTPGKINMEPENKPLGKGETSSKPSFSGSILILGGVSD